MKKISAMALSAALLLSMTACGNNSSSGSEDSSTDTSSSNPGESSEPSSENSSDSSAPEEEQSSEPAPEEIPYVLGGELTPTMIANSRYNVGNQVRLANVLKRLQVGEAVTVAYLGGSITQGTSAGNDLCYARLTTNWLMEKFPEARINYVNAGIGATGSYIGVHRADAQVLSHNPDLVFVDFSVNDTTERTETNKSTYASLLNKLWSAPSSPAIVTIAMTQQNGTSFQEYHAEAVKKFDIPMISYKNAVLDVIKKGYIKWTDISDDDIHPNVPGHALLTDLITNYLQSVIDDLDSISGAESDFSAASEAEKKYVNAKLLMAENTTPQALGDFVPTETAFGGFDKPWLARSSSGQFSEYSGLTFEFEGTNVGILYGKLTGNGGTASVFIDDVITATIDAAFPGGWGNYVEYAEVATGLSEGKHTITILPLSREGSTAFYVSAIAVS